MKWVCACVWVENHLVIHFARASVRTHCTHTVFGVCERASLPPAPNPLKFSSLDVRMDALGSLTVASGSELAFSHGK